MEPIPVTFYKCPICGEIWENLEDALACIDRGVVPPKFMVGEEVFLKLRYPNSRERPFARATIEKVVLDGHEPGYVLDRPVLIGKDLHAGKHSLWDDEQVKADRTSELRRG